MTNVTQHPTRRAQLDAERHTPGATIDLRDSLYIALIALGTLIAATTLLHMWITGIWNGQLVLTAAGILLAWQAAKRHNTRP